jgi:uncharacterized protein YbaP (TraB family)
MKHLYFRGAGRLAGFIALASLCIAVAVSPAWTAERLLNGKGLLWKVEREGTQPSWVFGTMHVSDERVTTLPKQLVEVLTQVDSLSLELIFHDRMNDENQPLLLPEGRRLRDIIGKRMFGQLAERMSAYGVCEKQLDRFKPWAALNFLGPLSPEPARRESGNVFLDHYLQLIAAERGARVFALETPKEQLEVFDGMSERHQVDMLRHALRSKGRGKHKFERMVELYLKSDVAAILREATGRKVNSPEFARVFHKRILDSRNKIMVKRMAPRLTEGNALIAVGAAHLPGRVGILNLLAKQGYTVARVY